MSNTPLTSISPQQGIFEIETNVYGAPPDIDGNGKVEFLLTDIKDGWNGDGSFIGGFFYPNDQSLSFPGSNKADILYVDTYPGIFQENLYNTHRALGSVAHELQHLIHYKYDQKETDWVNEGLSELASYLCGYGLRSPGLYLENTGLSMISWNDNSSLAHYSRVALWTYFLYEKFGLPLIGHLAQSDQSGIDGFNIALQESGINSTFKVILSDFFKTLISDDPQQDLEYSFALPELQYLKIIPQNRIIYYPAQKEIVAGAYSLQAVEFTNGDSLSIHFENPFKYPVYINKTGYGMKSVLNEADSEYLFDIDFGKSYHTQTINFLNTSSSSDIVEFKTDSHTKYNIIELKYDKDSPTYSITSFNSNLKGTTNGIQYISPSDTAILKSIKFYNKSNPTDLRIHIYETPLSSGTNPSSVSVIEKNVVQNGWVSIDTEDLSLMRNENQTFDVGIEFLTDGAGVMGYESVSGTAHKDKSFIKGLSNSSFFYRLSQYQIAGAALDGTWMIRLEIATPYTGSNVRNNSKIESAKVFPMPFNPGQNSGLCTISYELDNFGPVRLKIYNLLGQLLYTGYDELGSGTFYWDGKNSNGQSAASGFYVIQLSTFKNKRNKKLLLIR